MMREEQWTEVLLEHIKGLGEPPYQGLAFDAPPVVQPGTTVFDVRDIVATVAGRYITVGSFVAYAAEAVRQALACHAFKHVTFLVDCLTLMIYKRLDSVTVLATVDALKKNAAAYVDLLVAVPYNDDLSTVVRVYWEAIGQTQSDSVQRIVGQPYPPEALKALKKLRKKMFDYMSDRCHKFASDNEFFLRTGVRMMSPLMADNNLHPLAEDENLQAMAVDHAEYMARESRNLGISVMSHEQWSSVYFYRGPPPVAPTGLRTRLTPIAP